MWEICWISSRLWMARNSEDSSWQKYVVIDEYVQVLFFRFVVDIGGTTESTDIKVLLCHIWMSC